MFCVYEHIRPDTNAVFYIGKGQGRRPYTIRNRNKYWCNIVAKAGGFTVRMVVEGVDEELAFLIEAERIDQLRRLGMKLCNMTDGGEGISGYVHTDATREFLRQQMRRTVAAHKDAWRNRQLGERNSAKKPGVGDKISKALSGRKLSDERKKKSSQPRGKNGKAKKVSFNGIQFDCIKDMSDFIGINYRTLVGRITRMKKCDLTTEDLTPLQAAIAA